MGTQTRNSERGKSSNSGLVRSLGGKSRPEWNWLASFFFPLHWTSTLWCVGSSIPNTVLCLLPYSLTCILLLLSVRTTMTSWSTTNASWLHSVQNFSICFSTLFLESKSLTKLFFLLKLIIGWWLVCGQRGWIRKHFSRKWGVRSKFSCVRYDVPYTIMNWYDVHTVMKIESPIIKCF